MGKKYTKAIAYREAAIARFEAEAAAGNFMYGDPVYHAKNIECIKAQIASFEASAKA